MESMEPVNSPSESPLQSTGLLTQAWIEGTSAMKNDPDGLREWQHAELSGPPLWDIEALTDVAVLETCTWLENGMLEVGGIAFIAGLPSDPGSLDVTLVLTDQTGMSRAISVARANKPDSETTDKDPWGYYGAARFSAEIDVADVFADFPRPGTLPTWDVAVDLKVAGVTRRVPFQQRTYGQFMRTLLSERLLGDFSSPRSSPLEAGFRLVLKGVQPRWPKGLTSPAEGSA